MFYIETDKGIINTLTNMYLDEHEGKIKSVKLQDIPQEKIDEYSDFISCVTKTSNPLRINSAQIQKEFFSNVTMKELNTISNNINTYSSESLKTSFKNDFNRIMKQYPKILNSKNIPKLPDTYINNRDSILYLTDLDYLDKDLELTFKSNVFYKDQLSSLYSLSVRLILPKYVIDKIECNHKKVFLYRSDSDKVIFSPTKTTSYTMRDRDLDTHFHYIQTNNNIFGKKLYDILPGATMYKVYINATFDEWSNIINTLSDLENEYIGQTLGVVYYNLINFANIEKLFNISPEVKSDIVKRLYDRKGN